MARDWTQLDLAAFGPIRAQQIAPPALKRGSLRKAEPPEYSAPRQKLDQGRGQDLGLHHMGLPGEGAVCRTGKEVAECLGPVSHPLGTLPTVHHLAGQ